MPTGIIQLHRNIAWLLLTAFATWAACDATYRAFRKGVFQPMRYAGRKPQYRRKEEPVRYWLSVLGAGAACLLFFAITLYFASLVIFDFR
jgi:hypothetical protein